MYQPKRKNSRDKRFARKANRRFNNQSLPDYVNATLEDSWIDAQLSNEESESMRQFAIELEESLDRVISQTWQGNYNVYTQEIDYLTIEEWQNEINPNWESEL